LLLIGVVEESIMEEVVESPGEEVDPWSVDIDEEVGVVVEMSDVVLDSEVICEVLEVVIGVVDDVVTPVPTTCLFGMMPCGGSCALTCAATPSRPSVRKASILIDRLLLRAEAYEVAKVVA
jgi:hypothetical protein